MSLRNPSDKDSQTQNGGVYLITGGLGNIGLVLVEHLAGSGKRGFDSHRAIGFPAKDEWETWLATHDEDDEISIKIRQLQRLETFGRWVMANCC